MDMSLGSSPIQQGDGAAKAPPSAPPNARTPDMQVATRIVAELEVRALIAPEQSNALRAQLAAGAMTQDEWIMVARRAIVAAEGEGESWSDGDGEDDGDSEAPQHD